jgi:phosphoesterase RecJ-like protein
MEISAEEIRSLVDRYDHIMLTAHVNPDGDAIGSLLAMREWLAFLGKDVAVVVDDTIEDKFSFLQGVEHVIKPQDIAIDDAWLTIILDATATDRIGDVAGLIKGKVLNIDHHISNEHFADYEYVRDDFAATGEILTDLFQRWDALITPSMANSLYLAIATDCGFFKFSNTTGHTLRMAAALVDSGAKPNCISEHLEERSFIKLRAISEVLKHIELFGNNRVAGITFDADLLHYTGEHTGGYIDYARSVKGVDIAFTVKYIAPEETRVSIRSKNIDVNAVAAVFGGGGHIRAAGCTIHKSLQEAKKILVKEIIKAL